MPVVPIFTWTGFYVGVNAGIAWSDNNNNAVFVPAGTGGGIFLTDVFLPGIGGSNDAVFAGGGQIGYNWQGAGGWVFGIEADLQWADLGQSNRPLGFGIVGVPAGFTFAATNTGVEWFGTVRGRIGYAWDRTLLYATGGFAFGGGGGGGINFCGGVVFDCGGGDDTRTGWTIGGGLEYAFTNNWTVKVEGLYVNLDGGGSNNGLLGFVNGNAVFLPPGFITNVIDEQTFGVVRVGLNYKF